MQHPECLLLRQKKQQHPSNKIERLRIADPRVVDRKGI